MCGAPVTASWRRRRRRGPGPIPAVALSAIWPGLGHFGHRNGRALLIAGVSLAAVVSGLVYAVSRGTRTLLLWGVSLSPLRALIGLSLCVLVLRAVVAVDAYQNAARRSLPGSGSRFAGFARWVTLLLLAVIIAAPHFLVIRFAIAQMTLLSDVFDTAQVQTAVPTPLPTTTAATTPPGADPPPEAAPPAPTPSTEATTTAATSPTTAAPPAATPAAAGSSTWDGESRLTIALLGSDAGFDRYGVRTDTIIVLSIDVDTGDAAAFSVPRNWRHVPFPEGTAASEQWPDGYPGLLNEIYGLGLEHPEAFPGVEDRAGHAVKSALAQLTGLRIQYYALLDMVGFVRIIDLFGGIDLYVGESINDRIKPIVPEGIYINIAVEPGHHHFDGLTALGYVRSRTGSTDWSRMTRQRCVIEALIDQVPPAEVVYRYADLAGIVSDHVATDIPLDRLEELVDLATKLDTSRVVTVNFIPPEFPPGDAPILPVRQAVNQALRDDATGANPALSDRCRPPDPS